ncbi:hypothetical protein RDABS01_025204 [Bienertia sinuspersici]
MDSSCKNCVKDEECGLGSLPDAILICILPLLPTKVTARTSVLCKRWRNLWIGVTAVEVELPFVKPITTNLLHYETNKVEEIKVTSAFFHVPPCIFQFETLVNLELNVSQRCTFFYFTTVNLPKLKLFCFSFGGGNLSTV